VRLPNTAHASQPWRIHEITSDFRLEDVWALPAQGHADDFRQLVGAFTSGITRDSPSSLTRTLVAIRSKLGGLLGWDSPDTGLGSRVSTLRERLPADLRDACGPDFENRTFKSLYLLEREFAAEFANQTVHGVLHLGWVADGTGGYSGRMAVLVKPHGLFGQAYMAAIRPFRHRVVYPDLMRRIERLWQAGASESSARITDREN
jgi:Protein of unknown function (DUF2867)